MRTRLPDHATPTPCPAPPCRSFQGPDCHDIDECLLGTDNCDFNAACHNTLGAYSCKCFIDFYGLGCVLC